jgi:enhancer of polycomb-like protein
MLFTRPLDLGKLEIAGIRPPPAPPIDGVATAQPFRCQGRIGRGGRIIFDRWNPLRAPIGKQASQFLQYNLDPMC